MDNKGQISVEYILFVGFVLALVLIIAVYVGDQNQQNTIATAARLGAVNGSTEIGILYNNVAPIRVDRINMTGGTNININIYLSNSNLTVTQKQTILGSVQQSIEAAGFTVQNNAGNNLTINTSTHYYLIKLA